MPTSPAVKPMAAPARQDLLAILGAELLVVGGLAASVVWRAGPSLVIGVCAATAAALAVLRASLGRSVWRPTANAVLALLLSFASTLPGIFFFLDLLNRTGGPCYERPLFNAAVLWVLVGPALVVVSMLVSPWRQSSFSLLIIQALHVFGWFLGAGNTMLCAMTI